MKILGIIPLKKGFLKGDLTYFSAQDIQPGSIVTVMLRSKEILGLVISSRDASHSKINIKDMDFQLKKVIEAKGKSIFREEYLKSILLTGDYFASNPNNAIVSLIPAIFREEYDQIFRIIKRSEKIAETPTLNSSLESESKNIHNEKLLLQDVALDRISTYKTLIRENFAAQKSVFIVLPTEGDILSFEEYLSKGIEGFTFSFHGNLKDKKIIEKFEKVITTKHPVLILATAPFLSIPRKDIGVIILEHESSNSYRMLSRPHFDLRVFVEIFASEINTKLIIGDTLLRFETIAKKDMEYYTSMHPLSFRINWSGEINVENPRSDKQNPEFKIFTDKTIESIKHKLSKGKNVFIFALRKGLASVTVCRDCGEMVSCLKCAAPLVLYNLQTNDTEEKRSGMFVCNKCEEEKNPDTVCTYCKSWNLMPLGIGTDTVVQNIEKIIAKDPDFPKAKIFQLDKESAKTKKGAEKIVKEFEEHPGSILVGTEMALFYLTQKTTLSVIASFDSLWSIPNFKMSERIIQLVLAIISKTEDRLIIQTKNENDDAIRAIENGNLLSFIRSELEDRAKLSYPPFKRFIKIKHLGSKSETTEAKMLLANVFKDYKPLIFSGFIAQIKNQHVTNALIKLNIDEWSLPILAPNSSIDRRLLAKLLSLPPSFEVSVDPEDLL